MPEQQASWLLQMSYHLGEDPQIRGAVLNFTLDRQYNVIHTSRSYISSTWEARQEDHLEFEASVGYGILSFK